MKSYGQYCALARALDVIGDRWSPLVVRELLVGPRRYGELLQGLPGIATNLLADRLRHLEGAGVVERDGDGRYRLTAWGEGLREPLYALARWSAPVTMTRGVGGDVFRADWLIHPVTVLFEGVDERRPAMTIEVRIDGTAMTIESHHGVVEVRAGAPRAPDLVIEGKPDAVAGLLGGYLDAEAAAELGATVVGDAGKLRRLYPRPAVPSTTP